MRVFVSTHLYAPSSRIGAWLATHEWLRGLVTAGHTVDVVTTRTARGTGPYELDGVRVSRWHRHQTPPLFDAADVVITHLGDVSGFHAEAIRRGVPSVRIAHSVPSDVGRVEGASLLVANSEATRTEIGWDGPTVVCHPPTWAEAHRTVPGSKVTVVNLSEHKGGRLFWRIAEAMPDVEFLAVKGGHGDQIIPDTIPTNVDLVPVQTDMRAVWAETRLLLFPSIWESWGMVAVEAACSGIPTVAHPSPGLREALGGAGRFVPRWDVDGWVAEIRRLSDPTEWAVASGAALRRASELDPARSVDDFVDAVEQTVARRTVGV